MSRIVLYSDAYIAIQLNMDREGVGVGGVGRATARERLFHGSRPAKRGRAPPTFQQDSQGSEKSFSLSSDFYF